MNTEVVLVKMNDYENKNMSIGKGFEPAKFGGLLLYRFVMGGQDRNRIIPQQNTSLSFRED